MVKHGRKCLRVVRDMTPKVNFGAPQKDQKMTNFGSFSGLSEPSVVGDYKKSVSRASPSSMSLESLFHNANYGETMVGNG